MPAPHRAVIKMNVDEKGLVRKYFLEEGVSGEKEEALYQAFDKGRSKRRAHPFRKRTGNRGRMVERRCLILEKMMKLDKRMSQIIASIERSITEVLQDETSARSLNRNNAKEVHCTFENDAEKVKAKIEKENNEQCAAQTYRIQIDEALFALHCQKQ